MFLRSTELASIVGRGQISVSKWEHGNVTPLLESALAISAALGCPVEILFLEQFKEIRKEVRKQMAKLPARRYPDFHPCPTRWAY